MLTKQPKKWCVYLLCDPDTQEPFYVGKGTEKRIYAHEQGRFGYNKDKRDIIQRIRSQGKEVLKKKIAEFPVEIDAYIYEWARTTQPGHMYEKLGRFILYTPLVWVTSAQTVKALLF